MIKARIIKLVGVCLLFITSISAQTDVDVLRFSNNQVNGSARNIGLGNTMGSIGGDISSLSNNPAGIGRYTTSEFTISPGFSIQDVNSTYLGNSFNERELTGVFSGFGIALAKGNNDPNKDWKGPNFAFGLNNKAILDQSIFLNGYNASSSLLGAFSDRLSGLSDAQAQEVYPFDASLAYLGNLIYQGEDGSYDPLVSKDNQVEGLITRKGKINEFSFGAAGNYKGKVLIGASIGIPIVSYDEVKTYSERDIRDSSFYFNSFSIREEVRTSGLGFNGKFGIIASPHKSVRLSAAFHTPTFYQMDDAFNASFNSDYDFVDPDDSLLYNAVVDLESPNGISEYTVITPWQATFGASFIMKTYGLISVEYGLSNMSSSRIKYKNITTSEKSYEERINDAIDDKYALQHQLKIGVEFMINPFYIRGGFQYESSPFADKTDKVGNLAQYIYSGGMGIRVKKLVFDIAYQYKQQDSYYFPYTLNDQVVEPANINQNNSLVVFTLGYKL